MQTLTFPTRYGAQFPTFWNRLWNTSWLLTLSALVYFALFITTLALSIVDSRTLTGAPVWFKPAKFAISSVLYCATVVWMLSFVEGRRRLVRLVASVTAIGLFIEIVIIVLQAARGVRSHFNFTTPLDGALFSIMGMVIIVIWAMNLLAAVLLLRQRLPDDAFAWSLRLALLITAVGAATGYLMTQPTPEQMAEIQSGRTPSIIGAHSVGVPDGGPGLPFTGWSTEGGDLRVPHFVGLHALQVVPLLGLLINRRWGGRLSQRRRTALVWIAASGYLGLVLLLVWQALRGQPVIAPDVTTLLALAGFIGAVIAAAAVVVVTARRSGHELEGED